VTDVSFTQIIPRISNLRVLKGDEKKEAEEMGGVEMESLIEFESSGVVSATLETSVILNWPAKEVASLPIILTVSLNGLQAKLNLILRDLFVECFVSDLQMNLKVQSLIGHKTKLKDVPKISETVERLVEQQLRNALCKRRRVSLMQLYASREI
jgi:maintenance of morphology protein 1